jgi:hypothetical protein
MNEHFWRVDKIARGHFQRMIRRAWLKYKWNKAEKKRKKAEKAKKNKGKKKKKKKKAAPKPEQVTDDAEGVTNIETIGMDDEEPQDEEMEGEMDGEAGEQEDKEEGEDEGASPSKEGSEVDRDDNSKSARDNLLSIASQYKLDLGPILDE